MESPTNVLLLTANVGSLFDNVGEIREGWLREFCTTVDSYKPHFIAMHFQEVGGKDYKSNMSHTDDFFNKIKSCTELQNFDRGCVYVDKDFEVEDNFTALGSMYFIHKSLTNCQLYDFKAKEFRTVLEHDVHFGSLDRVSTMEKEKFERTFWADTKWSRKGYMRTRWIIQDQELDLVNVHLFHDASNVIACSSSPSLYSTNRQKALEYVIGRVCEQRCSPLSFFIFGDFNFRLDTKNLLQNISTTEKLQKRENSTDKGEIITYEEENNDHKELILIETKKFVLNQTLFRENNKLGEVTWTKLRDYDKETAAFKDVITEEKISFPPSYPYSEDPAEPEQYMNTRCPSWCDRVLMSQSANELIQRSWVDEGSNPVYKTLGPNVCMGDHKPVFLFFALKTHEVRTQGLQMVPSGGGVDDTDSPSSSKPTWTS